MAGNLLGKRGFPMQHVPHDLAERGGAVKLSSIFSNRGEPEGGRGQAGAPPLLPHLPPHQVTERRWRLCSPLWWSHPLPCLRRQVRE